MQQLRGDIMGTIFDKDFDTIKQKMEKVDGASGREGDIFRYNNLAIKILKRPVYKHLEDGYDYLMTLSTKRFVLMKDKIYQDSRMIGYTMDYIDDSKTPIDDLPMTTLISELEKIKEDLETLKKQGVYIVDVHRNNIMYNNQLHIVDTASYMPISVYTELVDETLTETEMINSIHKDNLFQINAGISEFLSNRLSEKFTQKEKSDFKQKLFKDLLEDSPQTYIGDYLKNDFDNNSTISTYVTKRLHR